MMSKVVAFTVSEHVAEVCVSSSHYIFDDYWSAKLPNKLQVCQKIIMGKETRWFSLGGFEVLDFEPVIWGSVLEICYTGTPTTNLILSFV